MLTGQQEAGADGIVYIRLNYFILFYGSTVQYDYDTYRSLPGYFKWQTYLICISCRLQPCACHTVGFNRTNFFKQKLECCNEDLNVQSVAGW